MTDDPAPSSPAVPAPAAPADPAASGPGASGATPDAPAVGSTPTAGQRRRRGDRPTPGSRVDPRMAATIVVGVAGGLLAASLVGATVSRLQGLLVTLVVSLFVSFGMEPAVQYLSRRGVPRGVGTAGVFVLTALLFFGFLAAMFPLVSSQVRNLVAAGPGVLDDLAARAQNLPGELGTAVSEWLAAQAQEVPRRIPSLAGSVVGGALGFGSTLAGGVLQVLTGTLVTFYLVADGPRLRRTLSSRLEPESQREFLQVWELAIAKTGGYVYSRALTAVVSAAFHVVAFTIIDVPYPIALGVWVGIISSLIPVVGTYLAGALPLVVALADRPVAALWVLVAIVVYQQVENYLVAPKITEHALELHPALAFVSVLVGGALLGAAGALLALPAVAIVAALMSAYGERHEVLEHGLTAEPARRRPDSPSPRRRATDHTPVPPGAPVPDDL
ncbi:MAG: AI-2E family transporter [Actinomycetes bacterium]